MASEIGLIKAFAVYTIGEVDEKQLKSYVVEQNRIRDLKPDDKESILGFDVPVMERPDQLLFPIGQIGYLLKVTERKHSYGRNLKFITKKLLEPKLREAAAELGEGEKVSENKRKKLQAEAKEEAKAEMRRDGRTDVHDREISVLIMLKEQLMFIDLDQNYKKYNEIAGLLKAAGIPSPARMVKDEGALRNAMTEVLKHSGLISKVDVGKDRQGEAYRVTLGESVRLKQQNAAENESPEVIQARHFELTNVRSEINEHINSECQKMSEQLEFYITNGENKTYHCTLSTGSYFTGVGWLKRKGQVTTEEGDAYIVDTAVKAAGIMVAFKNLLQSLEGLTA